MYSLHLSAEQLEFRDTVRDFVTQEIKPVVLKAERLDACDRRLPIDLLDKAARLGLRTLALSEAAGGAGADSLSSCIVTEELAAGDADIAAVLSQTSALAPLLFDRLMTPAQRERFLPQFLADDRYHLALVDPAAEVALGINYHRPVTDPAETITATRAGDVIILTGAQANVANAPVAKLFVVHVSGELLLVPCDTPGLAVREPADRWFHGAAGEVVLDNCRVGADALLSGSLGAAVPLSAALNLGIGRAAYEAALDYTQLRVQGGRRIIEHQAIATILAEIAIKLEASRALVWRAAWASDHPEAHADRSLPDLPLATIARVYTAQAVYAAAKGAAECFGAMGVMRDMPLQKYVHDALICLHTGVGASDDTLRIAEALAGYRRSALQAAE